MNPYICYFEFHYLSVLKKKHMCVWNINEAIENVAVKAQLT